MFRESLGSPMINPATLEPFPRRVTAQKSGIYGNYEPNYGDPIESHRERHQMLAMRLRVKEAEKLPFDDLHTSLGKEKVFVFVMQSDTAVTLEDDRNLFPSDALITQLRLIAK